MQLLLLRSRLLLRMLLSQRCLLYTSSGHSIIEVPHARFWQAKHQGSSISTLNRSSNVARSTVYLPIRRFLWLVCTPCPIMASAYWYAQDDRMLLFTCLLSLLLAGFVGLFLRTSALNLR